VPRDAAAANQAESEEIIETAIVGSAAVNLIINNRSGGNAPLIFQVISAKFLMEQQFTPVKQMDIW